MSFVFKDHSYERPNILTSMTLSDRSLMEIKLELRGQKKRIANNLLVHCFLNFVGVFDVYEMVNSLSISSVLWIAIKRRLKRKSY